MQHNHHQHNEPDKTPKPGTFQLILADPPWKPGQGTGRLSAATHYPLMDNDQIVAMGDAVKHIAADDAWLMLWSTDAAIPLAIQEVLPAWGFRWHRPFSWVRSQMGLGDFPRTAAEWCIVGKRGKPKPAFRSQPNWAFWPRQNHSHKPEEMHLICDRNLGDPDIPRLELFARRDAPTTAHWDIWGLECQSTISLARFGYPVPSDFDDQPTGQRLLPAGQEKRDE